MGENRIGMVQRAFESGMNTIADMVTRLIASGAAPEVAACIVAEVFAAGVSSAEVRRHSVDETAERRRAKDRDRKRLLRGNLRKSADIPQKSADAHNNILTSLSISEEHSEKQESKKVSTRRKSAIPLSADWQPNEKHFEAAEKLGISRNAVFEKVEDMRIWAASKDIRRPGWDATFHGFLRRDAKQQGKLNGQTHSNGLQRALAGLREHVGDIERGEEGRGPPPRLLSHG